MRNCPTTSGRTCEIRQSCAGNQCADAYGVDAAGMVVTSGPRDCSVAGSAQLGKRSSQKRAWSCRWELALAHLGAYLLAITAAAIGYAFVAVTIYLCCGYADRLASK